MADREKTLKGLECVITHKVPCEECPYMESGYYCLRNIAKDASTLLKEQEGLTQKMWNALYAEEDKFEKKFIGTEEHDDWFTVYRPWLQRGFEIAIKVIAEQDGM